jgi:hypothetical protein
MKTVWISALTHDQARVTAVIELLKRYGLQAQGHFWVDMPDKLSWRLVQDAMKEAKADLWLILADEAEMAKPTVRYGLSLLSASLQEARGVNFPILMLWNCPAPAAATLPQLLQSATQIEEASSSFAAKIVAKANLSGKGIAPEYRLSVLGDEKLGQWFEIGPRQGAWDGVLFGIAGANAEITFQAVGPAGSLPEKAVLEYAQEGLKLEVGGREFTAWAVRNSVGAASSYYARIKGLPDALLFMQYTEDSDAEASIIRLL